MQIIGKDLCKAYGDRVVLRNVNFTVENGITQILGPSGIGKTTLLRILLGLEMPDSGSVFPRRIRWAAVFQENRLLEAWGAEGNLRFALGESYDPERARDMLCRLGLGNVGTQTVSSYSGGMKRRLALARALLSEADAVILDEPFTGLDSENRQMAMKCIHDTAKAHPVLLVTHEQDERFPSFSL